MQELEFTTRESLKISLCSIFFAHAAYSEVEISPLQTFQDRVIVFLVLSLFVPSETWGLHCRCQSAVGRGLQLNISHRPRTFRWFSSHCPGFYATLPKAVILHIYSLLHAYLQNFENSNSSYTYTLRWRSKPIEKFDKHSSDVYTICTQAQKANKAMGYMMPVKNICFLNKYFRELLLIQVAIGSSQRKNPLMTNQQINEE